MFKILSLLILSSMALFASDSPLYEQVDLLFFGALGMMIIYNLAYFVVFKVNSYFEYFLFHCLLFIMMLSYSALLPSSFFTYNLENVPMVLFFISVLILTSFTRTFLELSRVEPKLDKLVKNFQFASLFFFALSLFEINNVYVVSLGVLYVIALSSLLLVISFYLGFVKNQINAKFYFLAFLGLFTALIFSLLSYFSLVAPSQVMTYFFEASIIFEATIFSFALSYKHRETQVALKQNELLFKELSHRVKNNLQSIISILSLQKSRLKEPILKEYMQETIKRIRSISLIHEKLQDTDVVANVEINGYLNSLTDEFRTLNTAVQITVECEDGLYLGVEKTTPLGLILNELVSNSFKHAFGNIDTPKIEITFIKTESGYTFTYSDNGNGYTEATESLGSLLIKTLSETQLKGSYTIVSDGEYTFTLRWSDHAI